MSYLCITNLLCNEQNELHNRAMHISEIYKSFQKADIDTVKADIDILQIYGDDLKVFSPKTVKYIQKMYCSLRESKAFGRADVQKITQLGHTRASELLKELVEVKLIETVSGYGKGKYRFCKK